MPEVTFPRTEMRDIRSSAGDAYRIFIARPDGEPGRDGFPVLYLLDGNATFATAAISVALQSRRTQATGIGPSVVVGIGYPTDDYVNAARRSYDYTPSVPVETLGARPDGSPWPKTGGAERFLDFLQDELQSLIGGDIPIDQNRQALFGHSFGGLFVLNALFTRPGAFRSYIAASPSIWFGNRAILEKRDAYVAAMSPGAPERDLLVTVGSLEQLGVDAEAPVTADARKTDWLIRNRMVENARDLVTSLSGVRHLNATFKEFDDENHSSVLPAAISRAIRFALSVTAR
jgi:predicted alpha/beta superfamily hydrolase